MEQKVFVSLSIKRFLLYALKKLTSKYIHWRWTVKIISITSMMIESVRSHLSTSCSNGFTKRDPFIVDSVTWLSENNCFSILHPIDAL